MKTIDIAIAEEATLLAESLATVLVHLQYNILVTAQSVPALIKVPLPASRQPHICLLNVSNHVNMDMIPTLKKHWPCAAILGYSNDDQIGDIERVGEQLDFYISSKDSVMTLHKTLLKSFLRSYSPTH